MTPADIQERRVEMRDLASAITEVRDDVRVIKAVIAGDSLTGVIGLQGRVHRLERENSSRRLYRTMVAIGTAIGAMVGAAASAIGIGQKH